VENPLFFSFFVKTALFWVFLLKKKKSKVELARFKSSLAVWALVRVKSYNHEKSRFLLLFQVFLKPKKNIEGWVGPYQLPTHDPGLNSDQGVL
jgi:hypothetical protein